MTHNERMVIDWTLRRFAELDHNQQQGFWHTWTKLEVPTNYLNYKDDTALLFFQVQDAETQSVILDFLELILRRLKQCAREQADIAE